MSAALSVHYWSAQGFSLAPEASLLLVAVNTEKTSIRAAARQQVRAVTQEILARHCGCLPTEISFSDAAGQPPRVHQHPHIGISFSHEAGFSLVAMNFAGPVGVDLLYLPENPDWVAEIDCLASDYLGCAITEDSARQRQINFAKAWTAQEARLKRLGWSLSEFCPDRQKQLDCCALSFLQLPQGFFGAVAY